MAARQSLSPIDPFALLVEAAPDGVCFAHVPALPGLCFKADDPQRLQAVAVDEIVAYGRWLIEEKLENLNRLAADLVSHIRFGSLTDIQVVETERRNGASLWISGNAAVLFDADMHALSDGEIHAHLLVTRTMVRRIWAILDRFTQQQRTAKPAPGRRSIEQTLSHIGDCVWWYCSRIDDTLPEPSERPHEDPIDRIERLLEAAREFLLAVSVGRRSGIYVPQRFPTSDPAEPWNHTKVCRRQAEHVWEHLQALRRKSDMSSGNSG